MVNKIYLGTLAAALIVMSFFTYYLWSWLQSIGSPAAVVENFDFFAGWSRVFLWISAVVLMLVSNAVLWTYRRSWAMWITATYFAIFIVIKYFWLDQAFVVFKKTNGFSDSSINWGPFFGVILCLVAGGIVFFDQFIIVRLAEKMHPTPGLETTSKDEIETESEN